MKRKKKRPVGKCNNQVLKELCRSGVVHDYQEEKKKRIQSSIEKGEEKKKTTTDKTRFPGPSLLFGENDEAQAAGPLPLEKSIQHTAHREERNGEREMNKTTIFLNKKKKERPRRVKMRERRPKGKTGDELVCRCERAVMNREFVTRFTHKHHQKESQTLATPCPKQQQRHLSTTDTAYGWHVVYKLYDPVLYSFHFHFHLPPLPPQSSVIRHI